MRERRSHREVKEPSLLGLGAGLVVDTEKAFRQGRDGVEDAKVLEEWDERR